MANDSKQLSPEDQARVDRVLSSPTYDSDRPPFRPFRLMLTLWGVLVALGLLSYGLARYHGVI